MVELQCLLFHAALPACHQARDSPIFFAPTLFVP